MEEEANSRGSDKKHIISMLLESENNELSFIPIIGMSGMGKTALVTQVFDDRHVHDYFAIRHCICMSDIHRGPTKLLDLVFRQRTSDVKIRNEFQSIVEGKRYLLILDGVTQGDHGVFLKELLRNVSVGSKVILTASSLSTLGNLEPLPVVQGAPYELGFLSEDESWALFKSIAFGDDTEKGQRSSGNKSENGYRTYEKCPHIPRLLQNIARLLHSTSKPENFHNISNLPEAFLSKLDLGSYKEQPSNMQQCVIYCSLFPENYKFSKADLIHLWHAQDYLLTTERRPEELVGDEFFRELQTNGNFFKHNNTDSNTAIARYNVTSAVNEFLRSVAEPEFYVADERVGETHKVDILHLSFPVADSPWEAPSWLLDAKQLKSLLFLPCKSATVGSITNIGEVLSSLQSLRALDLAAVNCENLPDSLGELNELRYLRLGVSCEYLPQSITNLTNLQTLDLRNSNVIVLPRRFHRLVGLRHLYTGDRLIDLPPNFGDLTSLQTLDVFIVGENNTLDALDELTNLVGKLKIRYEKQNEKDKLKESAGLLKDTYLTDLSLIWSSSYRETPADELTCLEPPPSLKSLQICRWKGSWFPQQLMDTFLMLHSLVSLHIEDCGNCQILPSLCSLPHLRSLGLWDLSALKYIETLVDNNNTASSTADYFPSLQSLMLANLPGLEGWSDKNDPKKHIFPSLVELKVSGCPKLMSIPQVQVLESLEVHNVHAALLEDIMSSSSVDHTLKNLIMVAVNGLDQFSVNVCLESLVVRQCKQIKTLIADNVPPRQLRQLKVYECGNLVDIMSALKHVKLLEELEIKRCEALNWEDMKQDGNTNDNSDGSSGEVGAWQILKEVRSLKIMNFSNLELIPKGISFLGKLEELSLYSLLKLKALPEWIGKLTKLRRLVIQNCPLLTKLPESIGSCDKLQQIKIYSCLKMKEYPARLETLPIFDIKECPKLLKPSQQAADDSGD